jgi:FMN phosphatase YigB (HAD superfamily)
VVIAAARRWKAAGYRLGVCTNNFAELGPVWRERLPMELFDAVVVSCEIGLRKTRSRERAAFQPSVG